MKYEYYKGYYIEAETYQRQRPCFRPIIVVTNTVKSLLNKSAKVSFAKDRELFSLYGLDQMTHRIYVKKGYLGRSVYSFKKPSYSIPSEWIGSRYKKEVTSFLKDGIPLEWKVDFDFDLQGDTNRLK